jgi:hypothetical protein
VTTYKGPDFLDLISQGFHPGRSTEKPVLKGMPEVIPTAIYEPELTPRASL